ncbi:thymidylate kinase [Streptomyces phage Jay2Jay]|uniref:Thymidylate kinase n=2 Tax=Samistivirus jay2jay TaxID=2560786 RepID=A0A221SB04_9CAUD|nr:thymidylate kinase [Streptomyces phage Jay2Jay]AIW02595.1 thymidylate kinase [Streptomyces phage Jay2Jay]ASN73170.1 thymidylate kinase [Streptomyces phage Warpy]
MLTSMMKIGMMGAHGTGKTSMAQAMLDGPFSTFSLVPSTARQIKAYGYPINREATELSQILVPLLRMVDEAEAFTDQHNRMYKQGLISDRTLVDSLAYTMYQNANVWDNGALIEHVTMRLAQMHIGTYAVLLYFPIYWDNVDDGVRDPDEQYRREIDNNIKTILELLDIRYYTVPNVAPEIRAEWLVQKIYRADEENAQRWMSAFQNML